MNKKSSSQFAKEVINKEISALKRTVRLIDNNFGDACNIIINNKRKSDYPSIGEIKLYYNEDGCNAK